MAGDQGGLAATRPLQRLGVQIGQRAAPRLVTTPTRIISTAVGTAESGVSERGWDNDRTCKRHPGRVAADGRRDVRAPGQHPIDRYTPARRATAGPMQAWGCSRTRPTSSWCSRNWSRTRRGAQHGCVDDGHLARAAHRENRGARHLALHPSATTQPRPDGSCCVCVSSANSATAGAGSRRPLARSCGRATPCGH